MALLDHACQTPERTALIFVPENGTEEHISYAQFAHSAQAAAQALRAAGVQPGDLVILVLRHSPMLLYGFWGAMFLGAKASIFPFLTEKLDPDIYMERVKALVEHAGARAVITFPEFEALLRALLKDAGCAVLSTDALTHAGGSEPLATPPPTDTASIAFLQHSSGTTGLQKGVALTHEAVMNQVQAYREAIQLNDEDVVVSWLPLYHDMGLIAGFVMPLVCGVPLALMSPFKWVGSPKMLLHAIHHHHGTLCWLPNFAYNHMARSVRPSDVQGLDLSHMRAFINCSEPVFHESHQVFLSKFSACGVRAEMLQTCYAMAENTFAVTQSRLGQPARLDWVQTQALQAERRALPVAANSEGASVLVSCGTPVDGTELRIVDEQGQPLPERRVGEICLRSNCMLSGYYHRPEITAEAIMDGWYHTGDMGYLAEGELFITGRKKDLIIVGGKNVYPQDLEAIANHLPGLAPGRSVAFGVMDPRLGSENIVMVCEAEDPDLSEEGRRRIESELRQRVVQRSEVSLWDVRLVQRKWLIKTSSGKISRSANRDKYLRELA